MVLFNQPQTYYRAFQLALLSILYFSSAMASAEPEMHSQQTTQRAHQLLFSENTRHSLENMLPTGTLMIVHFAFDSSDLTDASKEGLDELAAELRSQNWLGRQISIQGHTDNLGSVKYNQGTGRKTSSNCQKIPQFSNGCTVGTVSINLVRK